MSIGESFAEVLARAKSGDHAALETIYRDVAPLVIGYLRSNRVRDAEDLAGEIFVTLVQRIDTFDGDEHHFRAWLLAISHRRMIDAARRSQRRPEILAPPEDLADHVSASASGEIRALEGLAAGRILEALDDLSPLQREALTLRVLADLRVSDIAQIMDKPETAVKALLHRASASMARVLNDRENADK